MSRGDERAIVNHSGIQPIDLRVLVLPDPVEVKTAGGIILPDQHKEREKYAMQHGTLVAVGENAWEEAAGRSFRVRQAAAGGSRAHLEIRRRRADRQGRQGIPADERRRCDRPSDRGGKLMASAALKIEPGTEIPGEGGDGGCYRGTTERDFEAEAKEHGWSPKEDFKGDPTAGSMPRPS
jgi:hypothetical protein